MVTGRRPFFEAAEYDAQYGHIQKGDAEKFWAGHAKTKVDFSDEFKDLIFAMVQPDPTKRISIQEVAAHPWVALEAPTQEQIQTIFSQR
tara:strand:- start:561 stop:827 length:267 start_codon:yes stop_codon:yes gene_type:complete